MAEVGELHEQVILLVDRVFLRILLQVLQIFKIQMKIATRGQFQTVADGRLQLVAALANQFRVEFEFGIRVRRANNVRDSVGDGHFRHLNRCFHCIRAVVQARKYVAMNVNHGKSLLLGKIPESVPVNNQD